MTDTIDQLAKEYEEFRTKFQTNAQAAMKKAFKEFFTNNPNVSSIYWTQYTPHFNDGEECIFNVHDMYFTIGEEVLERDNGIYIEDREGTFSTWGTAEGFETEQQNFKAFTTALNKLPEEIFKDAFGDHCEIIASRTGFDVEEYSHD